MDNQQRTRTKYIAQLIPVRMTNRSVLNQRQATKDAPVKSVDRENKAVHHIIGDTILKGINTKSLNKRVKYVRKMEQKSVICGKNYPFMT